MGLTSSYLLGIELYNELFLHRQSKVFANWETLDFSFEFLFFNGDPLWKASSNHRIERIGDGLNGPAFFNHLYRVTDIDQIAGDIDALAIDQKMIVLDKMTSLGAGVGKPETVNDIIQSAFQHDQQVCAGYAFLAVRFLKYQAELLFRKPVHALDLLFFTQLNAVIGNFTTAALSVLSGSVTAPIKGALIAVATVTFQK